MLLPTLALRNLLGAGLRTWLNVVALSFSFVAIIFLQGMYDGMNEQAVHASLGALYGGGQYWHERYDPYDPLTLPDAHGPLPASLEALIRSRQATPILIRQATIYPGGRFRGILLKGNGLDILWPELLTLSLSGLALLILSSLRFKKRLE